MPTFLKPAVLLAVVLIQLFHPLAPGATGLCVLVLLGALLVDISAQGGDEAGWSGWAKALLGPKILPFYAVMLAGTLVLGKTAPATGSGMASAPAASSGGEACSCGSSGASRKMVNAVAPAAQAANGNMRMVAAKAPAGTTPPASGGCSSGSGCGTSGGCGTGGCGASSGGACGCGSDAKKKTVAATSATAPQPIVSKQRSAPMPGPMVPAQTLNNRGTPPPGASPSASSPPAMAMAPPRPQIIRPGTMQGQGPPPGFAPAAPQPAAGQAMIHPGSRPVQPASGQPVVAPASSQVLPSPAASPAPAAAAGNAPSTPSQNTPPAASTNGQSPATNNQ